MLQLSNGQQNVTYDENMLNLLREKLVKMFFLDALLIYIYKVVVISQRDLMVNQHENHVQVIVELHHKRN